MNEREYPMFYSALQWTEANEIERELSEGRVPGVVSRMAVSEDEKRNRAWSLVEALRSQSAKWDRLAWKSQSD